MLIEIILALFIGIILGVITGLTPGIHINLVGAILLSISALLLKITSPITLIVFLVSMSIAHTFIDFIPTIFLGAPNEDTILSVLPGHELLKQGKAHEAVYLTSLGIIISLIPLILLSIIFIIFLPKIQPIIKFLIPIILLISSLFIILTEKNKFTAFFIFILAGFLGIAVLNSTLPDPLLPMLTGLFGISSLIISIKTKTQIPQQKYEIEKIKSKEIKRSMLSSSIISPLCSFIPALGSGQAAAISSSIIKATKREYLIITGSVNIIVLILSFIVLFSIQKSRTGIAAITSKITTLTISDLMIILTITVICSIICFFLTLKISKKFSQLISKINYKKTSISIIIFLTALVLIFSNFLGLYIMIISTLLGIYAIESGVKRINLMACLLIPTLIIYLF